MDLVGNRVEAQRSLYVNAWHRTEIHLLSAG